MSPATVWWSTGVGAPSSVPARHTIERAEEDKQFKAGFLLQARNAVAAVRGEDYDVVVYGGTSAGVTAAVQAKAMGNKPTADMLTTAHYFGRAGKQSLALAMAMRPEGVTAGQIIMACGAASGLPFRT